MLKTDIEPYLSGFDYELPERLIALRPARPRDSARLLVVRGDGSLEDRTILDLPKLLDRSDHLVFNTTKVLFAKIRGVRLKRDANGQDVEINLNLIEKVSENIWVVLARPGRRLKVDDRIEIAPEFFATVVSKLETGKFEIRFETFGKKITELLETHGEMPLPPYIDRRRASDESDKRDYQTEIAVGEPRSVAAPTASLHFTTRLLNALELTGVTRHNVKLHVGFGTFAPLNAENFHKNSLHSEWIEIDQQTANNLNLARHKGSKIIAIGTTAMRTIESCADGDGDIRHYFGNTNLFLKPGDKIRVTDGLLTNFHLPRSSLLMLVSALIGRKTMLAAYAHAIKNEYRFFSYGDACLLLP